MIGAVHILHLEDSTFDGDLVREFLLAEGLDCTLHRVWTREAFADALARDGFDLIIADYMLPDFDGFSALELARARAPDLPFIFVSGALGEELVVDALKRGATDYAVKQRLERLPGVVRRALAESEEREERRRAEIALRASEERFRAIVETTPECVKLVAADGTLLHMNSSGLAMLGPERAATAIGSSIYDLILPEHRDRFAAFSARIRRGEKGSLEYDMLDGAGQRRHLETHAAPFRDSDGSLVMLAITRDVTDRRRTEAALRERDERLRGLNETLEQRVVQATAAREAMLAKLHDAQRQETLGQLTGGVAHDFNNLLTPIVGGLDALRRRHGEDARAQRLIAGALQAADRAQTLVQRLLAFARRQVLDPCAVDVPTLIDGMADLITRSIGPQIRLVTPFAAGLPHARVDPAQLELALLNLALNARDAMPEGGTLRVDADRQVVGPEHGNGLRHGEYVRLSVTDSGVGMDETTLKRAIEPFYSTKGVGRGTGLGLSMVHGLAGQSGGALVLSSVPGKGTRAEIWLPVAAEPADSPNAYEAEPIAGSQPATILLVDDEPLVRAATTDMLADLGHSVIQADSAVQALETLDSRPLPELVVTDYLMPGMNGAELAAAIRTRHPAMPILLMTGYAGLAGGTMADLPLLPKPFRLPELAAVLARLLPVDPV
ncbi:MAG: response regulator [Alphaproteobacteria bacterium]